MSRVPLSQTQASFQTSILGSGWLPASLRERTVNSSQRKENNKQLKGVKKTKQNKKPKKTKNPYCTPENSLKVNICNNSGYYCLCHGIKMPTVGILSQLLIHGEKALSVSCQSGTLIGLLQQGFLTSEFLLDVVSPDLMTCGPLRS